MIRIYKQTKRRNIVIICISVAAILCASIGTFLQYYFIGFPKSVNENNFAIEIKEEHTKYEDIDLYGEFLLPKNTGNDKFKTIIFAHGADDDHDADITTLKSLVKSGYASYTFDFYGWSKRSTGPKGTNWFKPYAKENKNAYQEQVLHQVNDLNAVIKHVKTFEFVDKNHIYLLGSSMGGVTAALSAALNVEDIRATILQYPAMVLNKDAYNESSPYYINNFYKDVLILQGAKDNIVSLASSVELLNNYNKKINHASMIVYGNQSHVFKGKYQVTAAKDIYNFVENLERKTK